MTFSKVCSVCNESKEVTLFSLKRGKPKAQCKKCDSLYYKQYLEANAEKQKVRHKIYWEKYKGTVAQKAVNKSKCKRYQSKNLDKFRAYEAKRRAFQGKATPRWANLKVIMEIYSSCPDGFEVDHIIPINNPIVCGLHVEANLQYLPCSENRSKSNKFN